MENGPNSQLAYSLSMKKRVFSCHDTYIAVTCEKKGKKMGGVRSSTGQILFSVSKAHSRAVISPTDFNGITQTSGQTRT